jgi:ribosomal protein S18 acetylase RimI-like enzyme
MNPEIALRTDLRSDDLQPIIDLHGAVYAKECGWNTTFEGYVAGPLMAFAKRPSPRSRIWLAERGGTLVGCISIVEATVEDAQLRWFVVAPSERGKGLGKHLLSEALAFARAQGYARVFLWTEASLKAAAGLYGQAGFRKIEERPGWKWGANVVEEKWEMPLLVEQP